MATRVERYGDAAYRVGTLPLAWARIHRKGADLVFQHPGGGTVAVSSQCPAPEDVSLNVLTNHLLFGIDVKREYGRAPITLDGRAALRTHLQGELDGVPIELDLVVLKKNGCTYDLQLIAAAAEFSARQPDFSAFVQGFGTLAEK
jgi:hypothetical protein